MEKVTSEDLALPNFELVLKITKKGMLVYGI